ncbi:MAG: GntR family transcriptional regulator [Nitriliruptorales bacterium]|nr:GntR family transcriptional regulator [Nitriliruptorales bacterium]
MTEFLSPVMSGRISEQIVGQIIRLIQQGRLKPGDRLLSERDLAQRFGVSRVTVRDALRVLEVRGLIEIRTGAAGGAFVTAPSTEVLSERFGDLIAMSTLSVHDVVEARLVMELGIVDLVLVHATDHDLAALADICDRSRHLVRRGAYDTQLSNDFHYGLAMAAHNQAVSKISESFRGPLRMASVRARETGGAAHVRSVDDHMAIVEDLKRRDRTAVRHHLAHHLARGTDLVGFAVVLAGGPAIVRDLPSLGDRA